MEADRSRPRERVSRRCRATPAASHSRTRPRFAGRQTARDRRKRALVERVAREQRLVKLGLRSLDPAEPDLAQTETHMNTLDNSRAILLEELRNLETEPHKDETRRNRKRMEMLLHPDFMEFGRSGTRYTRSDILGGFGPERVLPAVQSRQFDLVVLAEGVALVTYLSAHEDAVGNLYRHTLRSSIWVCSDVGWQMRFHQGTPTTAAIIGQP
jgi:hypothetical protein